MRVDNPAEKQEIIELALQQAVGGGRIDACGFECHIGTHDLCHIDVCGSVDPK